MAVDTEDLTCTAGAGAVVDLLFHCITSAGEGARRVEQCLG